MADAHELTRRVLVAHDRLPGWTERFSARHGEPVVSRAGEAVTLSAPDGAVAAYDDVAPPEDFGLVLVRRGGYAVGRVAGGALVAHKCGTRYVQGTTKAGGWSQKRYARRRANQAGALVSECVEVVERLLGVRGALVFAGGDRRIVAEVLESTDLVLAPRWIEVHEPRFASLEPARRDARSYEVRLNSRA